jgi:hypothetical protein
MIKFVLGVFYGAFVLAGFTVFLLMVIDDIKKWRKK